MLVCPRCLSYQPERETCVVCGLSLPPREHAQVRTNLEEALSSIARGDEEGALSFFRSATTEAVVDERAWLGRVLMTARSLTRVNAPMILERAISVLPRDSAVYRCRRALLALARLDEPAALAEALLDGGCGEAALFVVETGLALPGVGPAEQARLWALEADAELLIGETAEAVGALTRAEALGCSSPAVHYVRGLEREREGKADEALDEYRTALGHARLRALVSLSMARLLVRQGEPGEAMACCRGAVVAGHQSPDLWRLYTKLALLLGLSDEAKVGIDALSAKASPERGSPVAGYPAPYRPLSGDDPEGVFRLKLPRLLEQRGVLRGEEILVRDWCFPLPPDLALAPESGLGGQGVVASVVTRGQHGFVACHAPSPRLVDASALGRDVIKAWSFLVEQGRLSSLTFVGNTLFASPVEDDIRDANQHLASRLGGAGAKVSLLVVGERAGVLG